MTQSFCRSVLYTPALKIKSLDKLEQLDADVIVVDLEDSVSPESKVQARTHIKTIFSNHKSEKTVFLRVNSLDSEWGEQDIQLGFEASFDGILVPKVDSAKSLNQILKKFDGFHKKLDVAKKLKLWIMVENAQCLVNLKKICKVGKNNLHGLVVGLNDFSISTGIANSDTRAGFSYVLSKIVLHAKAYGLMAIDSVYNAYQDHEGFLRECKQGKELGFDGKSLIHPGQINAAKDSFFAVQARNFKGPCNCRCIFETGKYGVGCYFDPGRNV